MNKTGIVSNEHDLTLIKNGTVVVDLPRRPLTVRRPSEILGMTFDASASLLGDMLIARGQATTILGAGGVGKSRLLLQLAVSMIIGRQFLDFETRGKGLKWLILQTENSNQRLKHDLEQLQGWLGPDWPLVDECLVLHTLEEDEDGFVNLDSPGNQQAIQDLIDREQPDIVVFDPLSHFAMGDPNKDQDMMRTCLTLNTLVKRGNPNRAIIVLHHALTGKAGALKATGYDRGSFGRNSKVLHAWTRAQINVAAGSKDNNTTLVISCGKCSNGKEFAPLAATLNPSTMLYDLDPAFDIEAWENLLAGKTNGGPKASAEDVADLCANPISKAELVQELTVEFGVSKSKAYQLVELAENLKLIRRGFSTKLYTRQ